MAFNSVVKDHPTKRAEGTVGDQLNNPNQLAKDISSAAAELKTITDYLDYLTPRHPLYTTVYKDYINKQRDHLNLLILREEG